ncbi:unnamed protein product [Brachionus calyciflorus]|uniref:WSC domain-containing protein n=1 Tax=Brachionus calyciflorus TaxID=104777 RepID=A0A813PF92_9BILA|nr:unnamed protein product [Brachionus calyciflorus]
MKSPQQLNLRKSPKTYSKYLGCFNDVVADRDLGYSNPFPTAVNSSHMSIQYCIDLCRSLDQTYAGLQFGQECYCGNSYGKHGETSKKDCFITCSGDKNSKCGGFLKNSVYSVALYYTTESLTTTTPSSTNEYFSDEITLNPFVVSTETTLPFTENISTEGEEITTQTYHPFIETTKETEPTISATIMMTTTKIGTIENLSTEITINSLSETTTPMHESTLTSSISTLSYSTTTTTTSQTSNNVVTQIILATTDVSTTTTEMQQNEFSTVLNELITNFVSTLTSSTVSTTSNIFLTSNLPITTTIPTSSSTSTPNIATTTTTTTTTTSPIVSTLGYEVQTSMISTTRMTTSDDLAKTVTDEIAKQTESNTIDESTKSTINNKVFTSVDTTTMPITGQTLLVSTSSGIISPRPIVTDPLAYLITKIRVNRSIDVRSDVFRNEITNGLQKAYLAAFTKANNLFYNQNSRQINSNPILNNKTIQINLVNVTLTGETNSDKTKNVVELRYYVLSDNQVVSSEYAADSINLLSGQEMAQYLNQEVESQGYVEVKPRQVVVSDQKLWIIATVLGPLLLIFLLFWVILFVYYKCINPRRAKKLEGKIDGTKVSDIVNENKNLSDESLITSDDNTSKPIGNKRGAKVKPMAKEKIDVGTQNDDDDILISDMSKQTKPNRTNKTNQNGTKDLIKLPELKSIQNSKIVPNPEFLKSEPTSELSDNENNIDADIRERANVEKWRNKQRNRERNNIRTENETKQSRRVSKRIGQQKIEEKSPNHEQIKNSQILRNKRNLETKSQVSILTNNTEILLNNPEHDYNPIIIAENAKPYKPHVPIKVHVENKPTVADTTRVYNPYPLQNEYEKYFKNGFLFEPINHQPSTSASHSPKRSNINANVNFTSDLISPYSRRENTLFLKTPTQNDKLLDYARQSKTSFGNVNHSFIKDDSEVESEFQNLNHLKNKPSDKMDKKYNGDEERYYEDELDLINKYRKKSENKLNANAELINSINQELKRLKTGYKPNGSNA